MVVPCGVWRWTTIALSVAIRQSRDRFCTQIYRGMNCRKNMFRRLFVIMAFGALCGTWNEPRMDSLQYAIASKTTLLKFSTLTRHPQIAEASEPSKATGTPGCRCVCSCGRRL